MLSKFGGHHEIKKNTIMLIQLPSQLSLAYFMYFNIALPRIAVHCSTGIPVPKTYCLLC